VGSPLLRTSIKEAASKPPTVLTNKNRMTPKIDQNQNDLQFNPHIRSLSANKDAKMSLNLNAIKRKSLPTNVNQNHKKIMKTDSKNLSK
jgi:poly(A) polymerase Pap1